MSTVAVVGSLSLDRIGGARPTIGGGAYHAARALRVVARHSQVLTRCGHADRRLLAPRLSAVGIPARIVSGERTTAFSFSYVGERRVMKVDAVGDSWRIEDVEVLDPRLRWVQVAPLLRSDFDAATLAALGRGRTMLLDGQGLVRVPRAGPLVLDGEFDDAMLEHVRILKLAEDEAEVVGDVDVPELVVTRGAHGATVRADGRSVDVRAHPLAREPTGAGDAFGAAYLAARADAFSPFAAARRATSVVAALL